MKALKILEFEPLKRFFKKCFLFLGLLIFSFSVLAQEAKTEINVKRKSAFTLGAIPVLSWERDYRVSDKSYLGFGIGAGLGGYYQAYFKKLHNEPKGNFSITVYIGSTYFPPLEGYYAAFIVNGGVFPAWDRFFDSGKFISLGIGAIAVYPISEADVNLKFMPMLRLKFGRWR